MEARITAAEARLAQLETECGLPEVVSDGPRLIALHEQMTSARADIDALYARWAELEALRAL
jgi:BMFP domain-containing protein YqiC